ncbi:MAG: bifunctional 23S rRNA (guanine(2069)-N(7))-methyltransferase RlmK/23S rRNA (guanine(2445)-N(2))-methyltransferase RlmL [Pseudomonadota bacterium]
MATDYFAACPKGLEDLLYQELSDLGVSECRATVAGVYFKAEGIDLYRVCLWSRLANKVLLPLINFPLNDDAGMYSSIRNIDWQQHLAPEACFRVDFTGTNKHIRNTQFGALRVKDAIVDFFQATVGRRPSVDKHNPDLIINGRLSNNRLYISLDLSGESLHRRGYRQQQGQAPLKENLAAAILLRAQWPQIAEQGGYLIDPMCGSGTLLIEGTLMAADIAPGLFRSTAQWGFSRWRQFDQRAWDSLLEDAQSRKHQGLERLRQRGFEARGYDCDRRVLHAAESNIALSGLGEFIRVLCKPINAFSKPTHKPMANGLLISNPPYGERLSEEKALVPVYQCLGERLRRDFIGWKAAVLSANPQLAKHMALRAQKKYRFFNGTIPADLRCFTVEKDAFFKEVKDHRANPWSARPDTVESLSEGALMVCNRIKKNQKQLSNWIRQNQIECYRLYDADIPEYAAAIDIYRDHVHIQEYAAPTSINEDKAQHRFRDLVDATYVALGCDEDAVVIKKRQRTRGKTQYQKQALQAHNREPSPIVVKEGQAQFYIDLWRYLDSGLFLDHRPVRRRMQQCVAGKRFLNLFCYTATATVQAALAGAQSSISVDMSNSYLAWARQNFELNNIQTKRHQLIRADCLQWLQDCRQGFDVIFLDPPSFSNSKKMQGILDIQRDHVALIKRCMELLKPEGRLLFSNNLRSFKIDQQALSAFSLDNITADTVDPDFKRNPKIHQCWEISHKPVGYY